MDAALPNIEQRAAEQPRPGLTPAVVNAVSAVQVPPQQLLAQQPVPSNEPITAPPPGKPIAWDGEHQIDTHFFPNHSPIRFAAYVESGGQMNVPAVANEASQQMPHLRAAEIVPVGTAHVAIAPPSQPQQQHAIVPLPEPPAQTIASAVAWNTEQRIDPHFFPDRSSNHVAAYVIQASRLRAAEIRPVGTAQVAIGPPQPAPQLSLPLSTIVSLADAGAQPSLPTTMANFASLSREPSADRIVPASPQAPTAPLATTPTGPRAIQSRFRWPRNLSNKRLHRRSSPPRPPRRLPSKTSASLAPIFHLVL